MLLALCCDLVVLVSAFATTTIFWFSVPVQEFMRTASEHAPHSTTVPSQTALRHFEDAQIAARMTFQPEHKGQHEGVQHCYPNPNPTSTPNEHVQPTTSNSRRIQSLTSAVMQHAP